MAEPKLTARQKAEQALQDAQATEELQEGLLAIDARLLRKRYEALKEAGFDSQRAFIIVQTRGLH